MALPRRRNRNLTRTRRQDPRAGPASRESTKGQSPGTTTYIALLRAVNLGGSTQVSMGDLRELLDRLGFRDVRSLLQSGNLIFRSDAGDDRRVERRLEAEIANLRGTETEVFVRTALEWRRIIAQNPFPQEAEIDPGHLLVSALKEAPSPEAWAKLRASIRGPERVEGRGRQAYIVYPDGVGRSHLTASLIERCLGTRGTSRNWNTVLKLDTLASG